jgi:hypothetical protein
VIVGDTGRAAGGGRTHGDHSALTGALLRSVRRSGTRSA